MISRDHLGKADKIFFGLVLGSALLVGGFLFWWYDPLRPGLAPCASADDVAEAVEVTNPDGFEGWPRPCTGLRAVLDVNGIPVSEARMEEVHLHAHLRIIAGGEDVEVPAGVGLEANGRPISPLHTHTPDGLLHVESPTARTYRLVEFMAVWGVPLTDDCIGGCAQVRDASSQSMWTADATMAPSTVWK